MHLLLHLCESLLLLLCCALLTNSVDLRLLHCGLLILQLLFLGLDGSQCFPLFCAFLPRSLVCARPKGLFVVVPLLAWIAISLLHYHDVLCPATYHSSSSPSRQLRSAQWAPLLRLTQTSRYYLWWWCCIQLFDPQVSNAPSENNLRPISIARTLFTR